MFLSTYVGFVVIGTSLIVGVPPVSDTSLKRWEFKRSSKCNLNEGFLTIEIQKWTFEEICSFEDKSFENV